MDLKSRLQSVNWVDIDALEVACKIPKGSIRLDVNQPIPDEYTSAIEAEISKLTGGGESEQQPEQEIAPDQSQQAQQGQAMNPQNLV